MMGLAQKFHKAYDSVPKNKKKLVKYNSIYFGPFSRVQINPSISKFF